MVNDDDEPAFTGPVSKLCPSSAVTVCAVLSSLATCTRPPATVSVLGANAKSLIVTPSAAAVGEEPVRAGGAALLAVSPPEPPQAVSRAAAATASVSDQ